MIIRGGAGAIRGGELGIRSDSLPWVASAMLLQGGIIGRVWCAVGDSFLTYPSICRSLVLLPGFLQSMNSARTGCR